MPSPRLVYTLADAAVTEGLATIRHELHIAEDFPSEVEAAAAEAAARRFTVTDARIDATDLALVTIDPAGSTDLDQAYHAERTPQGYRVHYAIADVAAFVDLGSPVAAEALERGVTLYAPDRRAPLYPESLSEGAASLLPDGERPALLWTIDVAADGTLGDAHVARALVRSREQLSYDEAQARIDAGTAAEPLLLLKEIGLARAAQEVARVQ